MIVVALLIVLAQASSSTLRVAAETGDEAPCTFVDGGWRCTALDPASGQWGRLVRVEAGSAGTNELHDLTLSPWTPERSAVRAKLRKFRALRDGSVRVLKLSPTVFWVTGAATVDPDAFIALAGPDIGAVHVAIPRLLQDASENPHVIQAPMRQSIIGRIRNVGGEVVPASVEVLRPLRSDSERPNAATPVIAVAAGAADANGLFVFDGIVEPPLLVAAASPVDGRGSVWVMNAGQPVVVDLMPPLRVRGRVLRNRVPFAGARVRFVPNSQAWASSVDPAAHLTDESVSAADGLFEIVLPEQATGELQIVAADGAVARVPILDALNRTRTIELGDVAVPDPRRIIVRLLEPLQSPPCDLLAIGPLGSLGMQTVRASSAVNVFTLDLPESGQWTFSAECGGRIQPVTPMITIVQPGASGSGVPAIDVRLAR